MTNTLVNTLSFDQFTPENVDSAVAYIRNEAGWHIAPAVTETLVVEAPRGAQLILPTKWLVSISAIRHSAYGGSPAMPITGWFSYPTKQFRSGIVTHSWGWPGYGILEVDVVHGYPRCPDDLLPVISQVAGDFSRNRPPGQIRQESVGSVSVSYNQGSLGSFSGLGNYILTGV